MPDAFTTAAPTQGADTTSKLSATEIASRSEKLNVVPADVVAQVEEAVSAMLPYQPLWWECLSFLDGDQFVERNAVSGSLDRVETRDGSTTKPRWRPRTVRNRFTTALVAEASQVTARVPAWECVPINGDPGPRAAARLGEKVLAALHQKLGLKAKILRVALGAATTGAGFVWPYWNGEVGDAIPEPEGEYGQESRTLMHTGEIGIHILAQDEVLWDPAVPFEESRFHVVRKAVPLRRLKARSDYIGPSTLSADAMTPKFREPVAGTRQDLVFVYHYLERPSMDFPKGRWIQYAGKHLVAPTGAYPVDYDEPCIHMLPWIPREHRHRALGLGEQLLDVQRTYNRTINQIIAWKNLVLAPQMLAPKGSLEQTITDEPGAVWSYKPMGGLKPEWRQAPDIPPTLFSTLDRCIADFEEITGQRQLPAGIESGPAIAAINERDESRRGLTSRGLAAFWATLGLHLLCLVRTHYTEKRLLVLQGRFGVELVQGFLADELDGVETVLVSEASVEPRSRAAQEAKIAMFADRQWITPAQAMAALNGGTAEYLINRYELDVAKQQREIQGMIEAGTSDPQEQLKKYGNLDAMPDAVSTPGPMDGHAVHIDVIDQYMLTRDFEMQPMAVRVALMEHRAMHAQFLAGQQAGQQMAQSQDAAQLGADNAAAPQDAKPEPSRSSLGAMAAGAQGLPNGG